MSDHTLPDDVLKSATQKMYDTTDWGFLRMRDRTWFERPLAAALPILISAIETALLERMITDADEDNVETSLYLVYADGHESRDPVMLVEWLRTYLPEVTL